MSEAEKRVSASGESGIDLWKHSASQQDLMHLSQGEFNAYYKLNPKVKQKPELREKNILLSVRHMKQFFFFGKGANRQKLKAVSDVSFDLKEGECLGIVGESGCGKTTTGRSIIGLYHITSGSVYYRGVRINAGDRWNRKENHETVVKMLNRVGLVEEHASRYPHEFSGGQKQRIGIARALIMNPKLLICDEPISALDVSIRAQIINLLNDLKRELNLSIIFIAHDLSVVKYFCDDIVVMYFGKVVEKASSDELFRHPIHPYTRSLLSAIPKPNPRSERVRKRITYDPATAHDYSNSKPTLREIFPGHFVLCDDAEMARYQAEFGDVK